MYDVAIYGSGFAGFSIATSLLERGKRVMVVEKGPQHDAATSLQLATVGSPWEPVESGGFDFGSPDLAPFKQRPRYTGLGGTSALWSGKWRRLDAIDFQRQRDGRAWPFTADMLEPHYRQAADRFGVSLDVSPDVHGIAVRAAVAGLRIVPIAVSTAPVRLAESWAGHAKSGNLEIRCDARELAFDVSGDVIKGARTRRQASDQWTEIAARTHVIAAGGIASAALVRSLRACAFGEPEAFLSGYMDHPKGDAGVLRPRRNLDDLDRILDAEGAELILGIALPEEELLKAGIGNHTIFLWGAPGRTSTGARARRARGVQVVVSAEQFPEPWNGLTNAGAETVQWRISGGTRRDIDAFLDRIIPRLDAHFGPVERRRWIQLRGASHPAGCTPMSHAPGPGELDADCRIHGLENAYCVSSSGFPLCGSANPTLTIAALGGRLADHLAGP